jgi:uncharacterized protein (DUF433 family)
VKSFDRLTHDPAVMGGRPCIRGMRITVDVAAAEVEAGRTIDEIPDDYPYLECKDIIQAQKFTAWLDSASEREIPDA